ncbi:hypothetical protein AAHC03_025573 [Spirometra sp. Aus1]
MSSKIMVSREDIQEYYFQLLSEIPEENPAQSSPKIHSDTSDAQDTFQQALKDDQGNTSPLEESEWEYLEVVLNRPPGQSRSFGFTIAGGYDAPQENGDPSVYVTRLAPGGIADVDDRLRPFDQIISVNGTDLTCVSNEEAVQILREAGDTLALIVRRYLGTESNSEMAFPIPAKRNSEARLMPGAEAELGGEGSSVNEPYWYEVDLVKTREDVGLGFSIAGGHNANDQLAYEGIFVTRISPGGLAAMNGQIQPGDRLLQVNGIDLGTATHEEAVRILRNAGTCVHLVLCRPPPPSDQGGSNLSFSIDDLAKKNRGFLSPSSTLSSAGPPSSTEAPRQATARYRKR